MTPNRVLLIIIGICLVVFIVSMFVYQTEIVVRWLARAALGGLFIYAVNLCLSLLHVSGPVGVNVVTVGISGVLGAPGVIMLYAIGIYQILS